MGALTVVWKALLSLDSSWELTACQAIDRLGTPVAVVSADEQEPDLCLLAYPASAHDQVVAGALVRDAVRTLRSYAGRRVGLIACDRAAPDVELSAVASLLDAQASQVPHRHPARAETVAAMEEKIDEWLRLTAHRLQLRPATQGNVVTDASASAELEGEEDRWPRQHLY